ncbi:MAG: DUF6263 family protein [Isosphaeraceae bacterium]
MMNRTAWSLRNAGRWRCARGSALLIAAAMLAGLAAAAPAAEELRWKFRPGETLKFSVEQKVVMSTKGAEIERKSTRTHTLDFTWKVLSVDASGEAEITHRIERIRLKSEDPPLATFDFDSASAGPPQPGFEAPTRELKSQVGAEFTFTMKPDGEITGIKLSEETLKHLRETAPPGASEAITEKSIKDSLIQSSPPAFPPGEVEPGKTWSAKPTRLPLPFTVLVMDKTFTYQGSDSRSPNLRLVGIEVSAKTEPIEGADIKAAIRKQEGKGSLTLDAEAGKVTSVRMNQKFEMAITLMGQTLEQTTEMTTAMTLKP